MELFRGICTCTWGIDVGYGECGGESEGNVVMLRGLDGGDV